MCVCCDAELVLNSISEYDDSSSTSYSLVLTVATYDFDSSICIKTILSIPLLGVDVNIASRSTIQVTDISLFHLFQRQSI